MISANVSVHFRIPLNNLTNCYDDNEIKSEEQQPHHKTWFLIYERFKEVPYKLYIKNSFSK